MGSPELGREIPVNDSEQTFEHGLKLSAVAEAYKPRALNPKSTIDHEAIHAGLGGRGDVELVSIVPGPGYNGITKFRRPNALAAMGPHAVGAHGTSWDVMVAHHISGGGTSESAARHAVHENHAAIAEIGDELGKNKVLTGSQVDAARDRAHQKMTYGEYATAFAQASTGEAVQVRVKVEGKKIIIPTEIVSFSAKVKKRLEEKEAEKAKAAKTEEQNTEPPRTRKPVEEPITETQKVVDSKGESTSKNKENIQQAAAMTEAEATVREQYQKILDEMKLRDVREKLATIQAEEESKPVPAAA